MLTTAKWALPYPEETDPDDPPVHLQALAAALDVTLTGWKADTWANRPVGAAIKDGLFFWAVDQGQFYVGQGGVLRSTSVTFGVAGDITTAAFGDAPGAGATGKAADAGHRHGMPANPITAHLASGDPHAQYALDTDLTGINSTATENKLISWMRPGVASPNLRRVGYSVFAATQVLFTVPAGRKYVVKSITLAGADAIVSGTASQPVNLWRTGGARNYWTSLTVPSNSTVDVGIAQVFNAGETLNLSSNATGVDVNVAYLDLAAADLPTRLIDAASYTVASGFNTAYTAPAGNGTVITSLMLGNLQATAQRVSVLVGPPATARAPIWRVSIAANGLLVFDTPIFLAATEVLQMAVYDTDNSISLLASGYPAQS